MEIVEYFTSDRRPELLAGLRRCDWEAGRLLVRLLTERTFDATLGGGRLFLLLDGAEIVSFLTLTRRDCVDAPEREPWIGFVYTFPEYRGARRAGVLLEHARREAAAAGAPFVFLATDETGLYEKYGFRYLESRPSVYGDDCRIYAAPALDILTAAAAARERAREVIAQSRVVEAWQSIGATVNPVGSMATGLLMKHRDIDFHLYTDELEPAESFRAMAQIAAQSAVTRLEYRNLAATEEACLEWHVWRRDRDGALWQIDLIQIRRGSRFDGFFEHVAGRIRAVLTPETRRAILELKYLTPESAGLSGIACCQAVLEGGVRTPAELAAWRKRQPADGLNLWCP